MVARSNHVQPVARPCNPRGISTRPAYFGPPARQLFGVFDAPFARVPGKLGVVLCYPHGRDYVAAHRAFRVLATRLAGAGFPVLRFDYSGTGDSWGDPEQASSEQWIDDIVTAIHQLRAVHGSLDVALVGLRMGAALATRAAVECPAIERLVLWEPVTDGREYVAELCARHQAWLDAEVRERRHARSLAQDDELLGYRFLESMRLDLESVSLSSIPKSPAPEVLLVSQETSAQYDGLVRRLVELGSRVDTRCVEGPKVWGTSPGMEQALVPNDVVQAIVGWLGAARS